MIFVKWRRPLKNNTRILQRCCVNSNTSFRRPQSLCYSITFLCWPRIKKKSFRNPSDYTIIFSGPCFSAIWPFPFQAHCRLPKKKRSTSRGHKSIFHDYKTNRTRRKKMYCQTNFSFDLFLSPVSFIWHIRRPLRWCAGADAGKRTIYLHSICIQTHAIQMTPLMSWSFINKFCSRKSLIKIIHVNILGAKQMGAQIG